MLESLSAALRLATAQVDAALNRVKFDESAWASMMEKSKVGVSNDRSKIEVERVRAYSIEIKGSERTHIGSAVSSRSL
jgi:hypothetical protein